MKTAISRSPTARRTLSSPPAGRTSPPQRIEKILRESRFISQAVAYGDRRKFISALITLDAEKRSPLG